MTSGTKQIRGTTLLIPTAGNPSSGSNKPYPCNGGSRDPLLTHAFTDPTRESDRQNLSHRLAPTAGSLQQNLKKQIFRQRLYSYNEVI